MFIPVQCGYYLQLIIIILKELYCETCLQYSDENLSWQLTNTAILEPTQSGIQLQGFEYTIKVQAGVHLYIKLIYKRM